MAYLIVDVSSLIKTCLFAGKDEENGKVVFHEGREVQVNSAQYGYDNAINSVVSCLTTTGHTPNQMILVVEKGSTKARRRVFFDGYKKDGPSRPQELMDSINAATDMVVNALRYVGATVVSQAGIEADDVIAYLVRNLKGERLTIFSNDGDLARLMDQEDVMMWKGGKIVSENPFGPFDCRHITLFKALVGDSSDTYPGAKGFGEKAWLDLLVNYGEHLDSLEGMVKRKVLHELEDDVAFFKPFRKVIDNADTVYACYRVATLYPEWVDGLRTPLVWKAGMVRPAEDYRLRPWAEQSRLVTAANYSAAYEFLASRVAQTEEFCLDLETSTCDESDDWLAQRTEKGGGVDVIASKITGCGLTFGSNGQYGFYCSVHHSDTDNITLEQLARLLMLIPKDRVTIAHNAHGFELPVMYLELSSFFGKDNGWRGFFPNMVDSRIAATYWDENQTTHGLKPLSDLLLDYQQETYEEVTTVERPVTYANDQGVEFDDIERVQLRMNQLSAKHVFSYGMDDCYTAQGIYNFFKIIMKTEGTFDTFMKIEQKPMYLSALSFVKGTPVDQGRLRTLHEADTILKAEMEKTLDKYLVAKGWDGTVYPVFEGELTASQVKDIVQIVLGIELKTQTRTVSKICKLIDGLDHEDAPMLAELIGSGDLDEVNRLVQDRFEGKPNFNVGSPKQIAHLMYEVIGLPIRLRNKATDAMKAKGIKLGNPQTDDDAINMALKFKDVEGEPAEVLKALLELKSINTRTSLYWTAYPKFVHWQTGRIHPEVQQCSTNTLRHAGSKPNIQQQDSNPDGVRSTIKAHHRDAVVVSCDLAGQEIRLLGDYSRDPNIMSAYIGDPPKDLHSFTAAMILGVSYDEFRERYKSEDEAVATVANAARQNGKTTFFASTYGAMAPKIALGLGISEELAQSYLDALDRAFPRVGPWKQETEEFASSYGWVPIMGGGRRHLRDLLLSPDGYTASKAKRQASNARIQRAGGTQIRRIMGRIWDSDLIDNYDYRFYWPVHDEIVNSVGSKDAVPVIKKLHAIMCEQFLDVLPSSSSIGIGRTYGQLVEIGEVPDPDKILEAVQIAFGGTKEVAVPA